MTKNLKKFTAGKIGYFFDKKLQFRTLKLQVKPSALYKEHPSLQNIKITYIFLYLVSLRTRYRGGSHTYADPDPGHP